MKKINLISLLTILVLTVSVQGTRAANSKNITGIWLGSMKVSEAVELQVGYVISDAIGGSLAATMNIIEQKAFDIPMDSVLFENDSVKILFQAAGISYIGEYSSEEKLIRGHYIQGEAKLELNLRPVEKLPGEVIRTQTPVGPFPYNEEEVVFENAEANVKLSGTLTIPKTGSEFPAVILVHGSGHTDRNETKMGHFMLLSDYLTRNGFAVLRFDKRGVGQSTGSYDEATTIDFAEDVEAGISWLKSRDDIDNENIGILGHSEGTLIAPMVASKQDDISFLILMGAMGANGGEIRVQQTQIISALNGVPQDEIDKNIEEINGYHKVLKTDYSRDSKFNTIKRMYPDLSDGMINYFLKPWYTTFIQLDPVEFIEKVHCPVLVLSGENDVQCPPEENLPLIESALKKAGNANYIVKSLPELNHLFQTSKTGLPMEYENIAEIIAPSALELILDWLLTNSKNS